MLPEDDANRQLASGFLLGLLFSRQIQVLEPPGGWHKVLSCFKTDHVGDMDKCPERLMVLLIDFDFQADRLSDAKGWVPDHLRDRVFILGVLSEPEELRACLGGYEAIGQNLAKDCREGSSTTWGHGLLRHNAGELDRLRDKARLLLFGQS